MRVGVRSHGRRAERGAGLQSGSFLPLSAPFATDFRWGEFKSREENDTVPYVLQTELQQFLSRNSVPLANADLTVPINPAPSAHEA